MKEGFLGTAAPLVADLILLLEIAMGVGLFTGAWLARTKRFESHAWCQSVIVLLNKPWMRSALVLWWGVLLLGIATYTRWYVPGLSRK